VQESKREAARSTVTGHGRGFEELDDRADVLRFLLQFLDDRGNRLFAFGPVLEIDEAGSSVRTTPFGQDLVACQGGDGGDALHPFGDRLQLSRDVVRSLEGRPWRGLDDRVDLPLILAGHEASGEDFAYLHNAGAKTGQKTERDEPSI